MKPLAVNLKNKFKIEKNKDNVVMIISCYNKFNYTYKCIKSIIKNKDDDYNYILYVFDDASPEKETELFFKNNIHKLKINTRYFKYKTNHHLTQQWNDSINYAFKNDNAKYIILLNNDIIVTPFWSKNLIDFLKKNKNKKIGPVGPLTTFGAGENQSLIAYLNKKFKFLKPLKISGIISRLLRASWSSSFCISLLSKKALMKKIYEKKPLKTNWILGFCMVLSKKTLMANIYKKNKDYNYYFNPNYICEGNESEFITRCNFKGFYPFIIYNSFIHHYYHKSNIKHIHSCFDPVKNNLAGKKINLIYKKPICLKDNNELMFFLLGFLIDPYTNDTIKEECLLKIPILTIKKFIDMFEDYKKNIENNEKIEEKEHKERLCFFLGQFYRILNKEFGDLSKEINLSKKHLYFEDYLSNKLKNELEKWKNKK